MLDMFKAIKYYFNVTK